MGEDRVSETAVAFRAALVAERDRLRAIEQPAQQRRWRVESLIEDLDRLLAGPAVPAPVEQPATVVLSPPPPPADPPPPVAPRDRPGKPRARSPLSAAERARELARHLAGGPRSVRELAAASGQTVFKVYYLVGRRELRDCFRAAYGAWSLTPRGRADLLGEADTPGTPISSGPATSAPTGSGSPGS